MSVAVTYQDITGQSAIKPEKNMHFPHAVYRFSCLLSVFLQCKEEQADSVFTKGILLVYQVSDPYE